MRATRSLIPGMIVLSRSKFSRFFRGVRLTVTGDAFTRVHYDISQCIPSRYLETGRCSSGYRRSHESSRYTPSRLWSGVRSRKSSLALVEFQPEEPLINVIITSPGERGAEICILIRALAVRIAIRYLNVNARGAKRIRA